MDVIITNNTFLYEEKVSYKLTTITKMEVKDEFKNFSSWLALSNFIFCMILVINFQYDNFSILSLIFLMTFGSISILGDIHYIITCRIRSLNICFDKHYLKIYSTKKIIDNINNEILLRRENKQDYTFKIDL